MGADPALVASQSSHSSVSRPSGFDPGAEDVKMTAENCPPGRYLLRENKAFSNVFEAEVLEWSSRGRVKIRYTGGSVDWREGYLLPLRVEALPALAAGAGTAETSETSAQSEGRQSGLSASEGNAQ